MATIKPWWYVTSTSFVNLLFCVYSAHFYPIACLLILLRYFFSQAYTYDAVRIACGKQVQSSGCSVALSDAGILKLSHQKPATRTSNGVIDSIDFDLNRDDAVDELKYFIASGDDSDNKEEPHDVDAVDIMVEEDLSFLFLKMNMAAQVNCQRKSKAKKHVLIEFRSDSDIKELLSHVQKVGSMAAFVCEEAKLDPIRAKEYGKVLLDDSKQEESRRLLSPVGAATDNKFLEGKDEEDVLLTFPFAADPVELDGIAEGLEELRGPTDIPAGPVVAATIETSSSEDGSEAGATARAAATPLRDILTLQVLHYNRLDPEVYLNDTLIDFWMRWIMRNGDNSMIHCFTTHFYTTLKEQGPEGVESWLTKKGINVFEKKITFVPVNLTLHWSLAVIINPGHIEGHIENMRKADEGELVDEDAPASCILFLDSLKAHSRARVANNLRKWLNFEWARLKNDSSLTKPFGKKEMNVYTPTST